MHERTITRLAAGLSLLALSALASAQERITLRIADQNRREHIRFGGLEFGQRQNPEALSRAADGLHIAKPD